jgi:hypothetical protein
MVYPLDQPVERSLLLRHLDRLLTDLERQPTLAALVDGESKRRGSWLSGRSIRTSAIQNLPWGVSHVQQYLPLLPMAIEQIDLGDADLVISSSHLVGKGVLTSPDQLHISYVHTPVRYAWDQMHAYLHRSALARRGLGPLHSLAIACVEAMGSTQRPACGSPHRELSLYCSPDS